LINPDCTLIMSATAPYQEARAVVAAALRDLSAASTSAPTLEEHRELGL
jgi:hypothetical protein